ncbi:MAG TPA: carboxymuconolactone decarboxylase family protein [Acidimicrobiales bacterium]|nr:carboxymuconolactone decarboxylase family protein [Acidimicrobiales bacterium]
MGYGKDVRDGLREPFRALRQALPGVMEGYTGLHNAAMAPGALDVKTKELIALAVAVAKQCDGCIAAHSRGAARQGATPEEVAEALGVAILLNGGPGTVYGPRAYQAFLEEVAPPPTS